MYSKAKIYNLALGALLLTRQIVNPDTDPSNEAKVLNQWWEVAFRSALASMNLTSTATQANLALVATCPVRHWKYAWQYPNNCALFRRIRSHAIVDTKDTHIPKLITIYNNKKVIFSNDHTHFDEVNDPNTPHAVGEFIPVDFPLNALSGPAGNAIAMKLAELSATLVTGKGAGKLKNEIIEKWKLARAEAQEQDALENFSFEEESTMSEFVAERLS